MEGSLFKVYLYHMKIILTEQQLKTVINESVHKVRYFEGEEYGIPEQIDWLVMQKEFIYLGQGSGHKLKLINNIIHNLQKIQG
jgi:hypothetical protein